MEQVFLVGVVITFIVFGAVLAYADRIASRRPDAGPAE
jgi:hypothetical protein